jgi:hypothetical protein
MQHSIHTRRLPPPRARLLVAAALLSGVLVAGCGGSSPGPAVARLSSTTTAGSTAGGGGAASSEPSSPSVLDADALAYAKCMRASGVPDFPDPQAGGGFLFHTRAGTNPSSPIFKEAQAKCRHFMPPGPGSGPPPSPQTLARFLKVAQCMRKHGAYDFPDPRTSVPSNPFGSGAGVISDIEGVILVFPSTIDEQSPAFTRAAAVCAFPLHNH